MADEERRARVMHRERALRRTKRAARLAGALAVFAAGVFYIAAPPPTLVGLVIAEWPPLIWGIAMIIGGAVSALGVWTRLMQIEQLGVLTTAVAVWLLALSQTMVMATRPPSWTMGGGTLILWALGAYAIARYVDLAADIRSSVQAQARDG